MPDDSDQLVKKLSYDDLMALVDKDLEVLAAILARRRAYEFVEDLGIWVPREIAEKWRRFSS